MAALHKERLDYNDGAERLPTSGGSQKNSPGRRRGHRCHRERLGWGTLDVRLVIHLQPPYRWENCSRRNAGRDRKPSAALPFRQATSTSAQLNRAETTPRHPPFL